MNVAGDGDGGGAEWELGHNDGAHLRLRHCLRHRPQQVGHCSAGEVCPGSRWERSWQVLPTIVWSSITLYRWGKTGWTVPENNLGRTAIPWSTIWRLISFWIKKWPSEGRWYALTCVTPGVTAWGHSISIIINQWHCGDVIVNQKENLCILA